MSDQPKCDICLDSGYVKPGGAVCSCGQALELLHSTFEDMQAYLRTTDLELRISPGAIFDIWTVSLHGMGEYNVGVAQDRDLVQAMRKAIQAAMRRTMKNSRLEEAYDTKAQKATCPETEIK